MSSCDDKSYFRLMYRPDPSRRVVVVVAAVNEIDSQK